MALVVQKFGGTSVANAEKITAAARRATRAWNSGKKVVVVVSARGDTTDELIDLASQISEKPPAREMDMLLSTGEQISVALMAMAIQEMGHPAISFTGAQVGIVTDNKHTKARIKSIDTKRMREALDDGKIVIVAGFQGIDEEGNITTLGRGGSDTTAVALAAVLKNQLIDEDSVDCEIFTDVDGIYTTDPRVVPEARKMDFISYDEMLELASVGASVMHSRSIEFAKKFNVPLRVRSSYLTDSDGTWIVPEADWMQNVPVVGAALVKDESRINLEGVPDEPGVSHRIFTAIAKENIVVDMIVQNVGTAGKASIGFTVQRNELQAALAVLHPIVSSMNANISFDDSVSKVSIIGTGMRTHTGVAERMFASLSEAEVNMQMITTSDIKISVLVSRNDGTKALRAVHSSFELDQPRAGAGLPVTIEHKTPFENKPVKPVASSPATDIQKISQQLAGMEEILVSDVLLDTDQGRITIENLPDLPGYCSKVFQAVAEAGIVVDMIVQNLSEPGKAHLSFSVPLAELERAHRFTNDMVHKLAPETVVSAESEIATLYVLGIGMRTHTGVAQRMFGALAAKNINISMINTSEVRVSVVVDREHGETALECLKEAFLVFQNKSV